MAIEINSQSHEILSPFCPEGKTGIKLYFKVLTDLV